MNLKSLSGHQRAGYIEEGTCDGLAQKQRARNYNKREVSDKRYMYMYTKETGAEQRRVIKSLPLPSPSAAV